jgi:hypothetical protein
MTTDDRGQTHYAGDGCDPPHPDPAGGELVTLSGGLLLVDPDCVVEVEVVDPLAPIEAGLRTDLDRVRETLRARRQERDQLAEQIRYLVAAEETLVSALRPFDRRRKAQE